MFALMTCGTLVSAVALGRVVNDQEHRLLDERAGEAAALLSSSLRGVTATLPVLGAVGELDPGGGSVLLGGVFRTGVGSIATFSRDPAGFVVTTSAGDGPAVGRRPDAARLALAERALATDGIVSAVFGEGTERRLAFATRTLPGVDHVVVQEMPFTRSLVQRNAGDDLFSELDGAVYASTSPSAARLVFSTTAQLPLSGRLAHRPIHVGADEWSLVARARTPLVGSFAHNSPWYLLGAGLTTALLIALLLDTLSRRRVYALNLVDVKTTELRDALAAQERLEQGQRRAREAAEEANRSKSEFLSRMSHELRTPLNAVLGFAQLLETEDLGNANHDSVQQIIKGGRHLLDLINEVLDITRIEAGAFQMSPEPVLVADAVVDVTNLTGPLATQAGVQLVTATREACNVHVLADRQRLTQILLNLVSNAIKYNRPGGAVSLTCEPTNTMLRIGVHDTGPGIRPEQRDLLFTPFERLGAEHTAIEGTGIGLALSRRLAEAMGGTINVETAVGQGSTFWVELPVVEAPVDRYLRLNRDRDAGPARAATSTTRSVLYIEDNLANLRLVERILDSYPTVELVSAMQGRLGVDLARQHQPVLILLDLHLPDLPGEEVLRQLRDDPATSAIPVAILSADATPGQIRRLLAEGAHSYLTKPLDVAKLRDLVDSIGTPVP